MNFAQNVAPFLVDFFQYYLDRGKTADGNNFKHQIVYFLMFMISQRKQIACISEIDRNDIEGYIEYLWNVEYGSQYKDTFLNRNNFVYRALRALHHFFEYLAIHEDTIDAQFLPQQDLIRKADFPSPHRRGSKHFPRWFENFLHESIRSLPEETIGQLRFKTLLLVLYNMGTRIKDACTLEADCLFEKYGVPWVKVFSNKTKLYYEVPIPFELKSSLEKYLARTEGLVRQHPTTHQTANFIFWVQPSWQFKTFMIRISRRVSKFNEAMREQAKEAGLPVNDIQTLSLTSHKYRHTVGIRLVRLGADPMLVAEFLGHTDLSMAQNYIQESQQEIDDLMAELWEDDTLGLSEELVDNLNFTRDEIFAFPGVISKVDGGLCALVGGKPPCGEDAYDCWQCENLKPDYEDPGYLNRLSDLLVEHQALRDRNVHRGHLGAAKMEEMVIQRIKGFMYEIEMKGAL